MRFSQRHDEYHRDFGAEPEPDDHPIREVEKSGEFHLDSRVVAAAGIERRVGRLRFAPEARYTFWACPKIVQYGPQGYSVQSMLHRLDVLVGVTWGGR